MNRISIVVAQVSLAVTLIVAGLVVCVVPNFPTQLMAGWYFDEDASPFTKEEAVTLAVCTKEYTFFNQDRTELYSSIVEVNKHAVEEGRSGAGAPVITEGDEESVGRAFDEADVAYAIQTDAVDHLDDVSRVVMIVFVIGFVALCVAAAVIMNAYFTHARSALPKILTGGGVLTLVVMLVAGAWAVVGFDSFFTALHSLFFADGTWTFAADSLLITMFPIPFWQGMGILWLSLTVVLAIISIVIGKVLKR